MEPDTVLQVVTRQENSSLVLNVMRALLFGIITLFVLCIPMGDPATSCDTKYTNGTYNQKMAICFLCDVYQYTVRAGNKFLECSEKLWCAFLNFLYESKLKTYSFLQTVDYKDFCAVCKVADKDQDDGSRCKCPRSKCKKCC